MSHHAHVMVATGECCSQETLQSSLNVRMTDAMRLKERGNSLLAEGSNRRALEAYVEGIGE